MIDSTFGWTETARQETRADYPRRCLATVATAIIAAVLGGCGGDIDADWEDAEALGVQSSALNVGQFHGWAQIPAGTFNSGPAIASSGSQTENVCGRGGDDKIYCNYWFNNVWFGWHLFGNDTFITRPGLADWQDGKGNHHMALVAIKSGGNVAVQVTGLAADGSREEAKGWVTLNGSGPSSLPAAIYWDDDRAIMYVLAVKADQRLYFASNVTAEGYNPLRWSAWTEVPGGGLFNSSVAITKVASSGHVAIVGRGNDNLFYVADGLTPDSMTGWHQIASPAQMVAPGIASRGSTVDVFGAFSTDEASHVATVNPKVNSAPVWSTVPNGQLDTPSAATTRTTAKLDLVGRGLDGFYYVNRWF